MLIRLALLPVLFLLACPPTAGANDHYTAPTVAMETQLERAKLLVLQYRLDSALVILDQLRNRLDQEGQLLSPFALRVRLRRGRALERKEDYLAATEALLGVIEDGKATQQPAVVAEAQLYMALIYEIQGETEMCVDYLDRAAGIIREHDLRELAPRLAIRRSSYQRLFGDPDRALREAQLAHELAHRQGSIEHLATSHLLLSFYFRETDPQQSLDHTRSALKYYNKQGDLVGYVFTVLSMARMKLNMGDAYAALQLNDTALVKARTEGSESMQSMGLLWPIYNARANILWDLGRKDSAWAYAQQGYQGELAYTVETLNDRAADIEARLAVEKSEKHIADQDQALAYEKQRRYFILLLFVLAVVFSGVLLYYSLRLRRANGQLESQSREIKGKNEDLALALREQKTLQGELHHRVKNNLQIIIGMLELQRFESGNEGDPDVLQSMAGRIYSMAAIHEILYDGDGVSKINLRQYVHNLCAHFAKLAGESVRPDFKIDIDDIFLNLDTTMPLGIMLHELLTNSYKYAMPPDGRLMITIRLHRADNTLILDYRDNGPGFEHNQLTAREGGLGSYLLTSMSRQLRGQVRTRNEDGGVVEIYFKMKNVTAPPAVV